MQGTGGGWFPSLGEKRTLFESMSLRIEAIVPPGMAGVFRLIARMLKSWR